MKKSTMNEDITIYPIYVLKRNGQLVLTDKIKSTADYNHYECNLHHYIKKQDYEKNKQWYEERGIKQKLILMPVFIHEQIHNQAIRVMSDDEFKTTFKIDKYKLIFNKRKY